MLCYNFVPNFVCALQHRFWSGSNKTRHFVMQQMDFATETAICYSHFLSVHPDEFLCKI